MDDQEVEAWYLEGWCFWLLAQGDEIGDGEDPQQAKPKPVELQDMTREEMLRDARDCLDTCAMLHVQQGHEDELLAQHVRELLGELEKLGVYTTPPEEEGGGEEGEEDEDWVDEEDADQDEEDVEMS